jgi:hypothetical protein
MSNEIEKAENILRDLRAKREAAVAHGHSLGEERTRLAFTAHGLGDSKARKRLDEINRESALHDSELRSLDCAISEAAARVDRARQAEVQAAARQKAEEARKHVDELAKCFPYLDRHLAEAARALIAIHDGVAQLHAAGFSFPSDAQLRLGIAAVIQTWAHRLPRSWHDQLRDGFEFLPPGRRQTATDYWSKIQASIDGQITQRLGEQKDSEAA